MTFKSYDFVTLNQVSQRKKKNTAVEREKCEMAVSPLHSTRQRSDLEFIAQVWTSASLSVFASL